MNAARGRIMHLDMDAFFASVEQVDHPELKGKPVIVGGGKRGVVSAASYEARAYGVHSAMPIFQARRLCPAGVFLRGNMARYKETSRQVMDILCRVSPLVEKASIDEAYVDLGPGASSESILRVARGVKQEVLEVTGLSCSIGVAPIRFAAKIASDFKKPNGLTIVEAADLAAFLAALPIEKLPGVGQKTAPTLKLLGVRLVGDVLRFPVAFWRERLGERGQRLWEKAMGLDDTPITPWSDPKSSSAEHTLEEDIGDVEILKKWLLAQAERVGRDLRKDGFKGRTVVLKLKFDDFSQITRSKTLAEPTSATMTIYAEAARLLESARLPRKVRLIGVGVANFDESARQLSLFHDKAAERQERLDKAVDAIRDKFGSAALKRGSTLELE